MLYEVQIRINDAAGPKAEYKDGMPVAFKIRGIDTPDESTSFGWGIYDRGEVHRVLLLDVPPSVHDQLSAILNEESPEPNKRKTYVIQYWNNQIGLPQATIDRMRDTSLLDEPLVDLTYLDLNNPAIVNNLIGLA